MRIVTLHCLLMGVVGVVGLGPLGCIGSKTQQCSWGTVCPSDRYCDETVHLCLYPSQAEVCRGVADATPLTECTFADAPEGAFACLGGLCLRSDCGDGRRGPGEVCDDGNVESGDGCSADCSSGETCGNGEVDPAVGESCDDGNHMSHDGCSSGCTFESVYYELLSSKLPERFGAAAAYDPLRQRTVVFSGFTGEPEVLTDTWEYDGDSWAEMPVVYPPWGRIDGSLTFLPSRGRVVLFAGWSGQVIMNDLWEFDGTGWSEIQPALVPPARSAHGAASDPGRDRLVIFGGELGDRNLLGDLWEFDSINWSRITTDATPAARRYPSMAYDEGTGRVVLFGGSRGLDPWVFLSDTWEYDGNNWTETTAPVAPDPRHGHQLGWDPVGERIILFGGMNEVGTLDDTWAYQNGVWSQLTPVASPPPRGQFIMTRDAVRDSLVVRGGNQGNYQCYGDAWELVGDDWVQFAKEIPKVRISPSMAYNSVQAVAVMFGGETYYDTGQHYGDTWLFADRLWRLVSTSMAPSARSYTPLVFDAGRELMVLFGGCSGVDCVQVHADTWIFDGVDWFAPTLGGGPPARGEHAMTYDASTQEVVLFGGVGDTGFRGDTWWFNGVRWKTENLLPSPSPRVMAQMAYDERLDRVVLFGGLSYSQEILGDTWELRADGWTQVYPVVSPPSRMGHRLIYHSGRRRIQLVGGYTPTQSFADLWEYDGTTWSYVALPVGAPWRADFGLVYDEKEREVVLFGGGNSSANPSNETLAYYYDSNWPEEVCHGGVDEDGDELIDCADPDCDGDPCGAASVCTAGECL